MTQKNVKKFLSLMLLLLWMGVIFYFSSVPGLMLGSESITLELVFRKIAHLVEYFILSISFFVFLKFNFNVSRQQIFYYSVLFVLLFAISDEIHQCFVVNREGRIIDIFIDLLGGTLSLAILNKFCKKLNK